MQSFVGQRHVRNRRAGAPGVVALAEGETTGTYTGVFTPSGAGTLVVTVKGFDSTPTLQAVAVVVC